MQLYLFGPTTLKNHSFDYRSDKAAFFQFNVKLPNLGAEKKKIGPGTYVFPFEVHLPASLPSTSEYVVEGAGYEIEVNSRMKSVVSTVICSAIDKKLTFRSINSVAVHFEIKIEHEKRKLSKQKILHCRLCSSPK
jgi:hypothetical protein